MSQNSQLPHWDLSNIYPNLESLEFENGFTQTIQQINDLETLLARENINRIENGTVNDETVRVFEKVINQYNEILNSVLTLRTYIYSFIATDSRNEMAQAKFSELQPYLAKLSLMGTQMTAWLGSLEIEKLIDNSEVAQDHAYALVRAKQDAEFLMSPIEENLAAELRLTGSTSWSRMFNNYISQITVPLTLGGEEQILPLTAAQNLAYNSDRFVREHAYEAILDTLGQAAVPLAAALNAIKGETLALAKRRKWASPLDMMLFENAMDRATLEAMMSACREAFPDFQRYLILRARVLGLPVMTWYDQLVPLGKGTQNWSYAAATQFVTKQFGTYSPKMMRLAETAFVESWLDADPRDGKRGGAFCMHVRDGESRILLNFEPEFTSVGTIAHELGHAYHNVNLARRTPLQRNMPMTLAETASTFCQKIVENAALASANEDDQLIIIDGLLEYATRVVLGGTSNFLFEERLFEKRAKRELSIDELCALDIETQRETRGDALDPEKLHPYRWAYIPHYYIATFYNFPYIFGLLFGLGLYAQYQMDSDNFRQGYDDLLSATGMGDAVSLAARFGIDLRQIDFWRASLDVLRADVAKFEALAQAV